MKYAQKLKEARTNAGLTQLDAATAIQRPQQTLAAWETGRSQPDANTLSELLQLYRVSPNDFFEYDDVPTHISNAEYNHIKKYRTLDAVSYTHLDVYKRQPLIVLCQNGRSSLLWISSSTLPQAPTSTASTKAGS